MEQLRIGPLLYQVVEVSDLKDDEGTPLHGQTRDDKMQILLNTQHTPESRFVTEWHEVLHALGAVFGLELSENQVTALASAIAQTLQDNPDLNWSEYERAVEANNAL